MFYRRYSNPNVWEDLERMRREFDRLVNSPSRFQTAPAFPPMNVWTNEEGAVVTTELPGSDLKDIDISVVNKTLSISGASNLDKNGDYQYHRQERSSGRFSRSLELPFGVDADKVEARFDQGVLVVKLPRAESDKPRKITVLGR